MLAQTHTPSAIFGSHVRYVVPLFQRPYVWNKEEQWQPLWDDISTLTDRLLEVTPGLYGGPPVPPHFLGAIVLDQQLTPSAYIGVRHVIDGQQRLTTLQIVLDAAQWVVEQHGHPMDSQALKVLVLNDASIAQHPDEVYKVWPTDRDQEAFRAAMDNQVTITKELSRSRIAQAHAFFVARVQQWAFAAGDDGAAERLHALVAALRDYLKVVVIDLEPGDNAQVIFETLNHRGAPLLAADLVKNFVFQMIEAQHDDVQGLYADHWRELDSDYWRQLVTQGRLYRPRIDVFLNYWLTMRFLREVPTDRVFSDFRDYVLTHQPDITELLRDLSADATVYKSLESLPATSVEGQFYYRIIRAMDSSAVGPILLWLLGHPEEQLPLEQRHRALQAIESWLVRRALCRATAKNVNLVVIDLLKELSKAGPAVAGDTVVAFLDGQLADSRLWPTDESVTASLASSEIYRSLTRARFRMVLEALEDSSRGELGEGVQCPRNLTVEHVMPQAWREYWKEDIGDDVAAGINRDHLVQTLGNLTLVNGKLNPTLSNRPWRFETEEGDEGKRAYLLSYSELKLNAHLVKNHEAGWTEQDITARTAELSRKVIELWPRPTPTTPIAQAGPDDDLEGLAADDSVGEDEDMPGHAGKYRALWSWLGDQDRDEIPMSFSDVEEILGMALPPSARNHEAHWYGYEGTALGRAIRDAGWKASQVNLTSERVTFVHD
ncbi:MAG: DUF262 domain-containing protein [Actinomycetales bacterium]|nr:DUF262 domain-containing protein [Actinomycetales bacterium]